MAALLFSILTSLFLLLSSYILFFFLSYLILAVRFRECMNSTFTLVILNGTYLLFSDTTSAQRVEIVIVLKVNIPRLFPSFKVG